MKHFKLFIIVVSLFTSVTTFAQENTIEASSQKKFLSQLSVGMRASTLGFGVEAATPLTDRFVLRGGISFASYTTSSIDISLDDPSGSFEKAFGYTPDYKMKGKLSFLNGHALVDFHPTKGIFHVTAGVFVGSNRLKADGFLADQNGDRATLQPGQSWPTINFNDHQLSVENGNVNAALHLGQVIKPYFGLGLGRAIANKRVAFKFELGLIYQGDYSIKQNGKKLPSVKDDVENFEDINTYTDLLKWWPMMNFQLSYRIF